LLALEKIEKLGKPQTELVDNEVKKIYSGDVIETLNEKKFFSTYYANFPFNDIAKNNF
jgi:hypothetical protein